MVETIIAIVMFFFIVGGVCVLISLFLPEEAKIEVAGFCATIMTILTIGYLAMKLWNKLFT